MTRPPIIPDDALKRLAQYWGRAELMHHLLHELLDGHNRGVQKVIDAGYELELETFLSFWLSGLFVVVEGFNRLKIKDPRVQRLFLAHVSDLKELRHETYHFTVSRLKGSKVISNLNWAEELHAAIGEFIEEHVTRRAHAERLLELRSKKRSKAR